MLDFVWAYGLPSWLSGKKKKEKKNPPANAGDLSVILVSGRSPGEGTGNLLQHSHRGNPKDRGPWQAPIHGVAMS